MVKNSAESQPRTTGNNGGSSNVAGIDHNHPLFLHASDTWKIKAVLLNKLHINMSDMIKAEFTIDLQLTNVHEEGSIAQVPQEQIMMSGRGTKPPLWMKKFVSINIHEGPYSVDKYPFYENITSTYKAYLSKMSHITEPQSYIEAASDPKWIEAMNVEIQALQDNQTWKVVDLPKGKKPIGCKWIFKVKYKSTGDIERNKARLVAKKVWPKRRHRLSRDIQSYGEDENSQDSLGYYCTK
ncbi:uncharacterized protein LOC129893047 [Solanum dulcamara]|uniref:uncharacterized protein LOC129893047 n=1 Tax=Solanum dulcamara TaxID=45834 RepID=UPI002485D27D|nr:uncharacterized protein LOC129893047 [Solanum dulcamara]